VTLAEVLQLRDRVALLDPAENPDSEAGEAASMVLAFHNAAVTGELIDGGDGGDTAA
jgi:hypothetical protein